MEIPHRLFLEITEECNLRCQLCKLWIQKDPPNRLTLVKKTQFLIKFLKWLENYNPKYKNSFCIILTGGEPFLFPNHVLEMSKICRINNINCYIHTNGSLIEPYLNDILKSGLTALTISLDSHFSNLHDDLRGRIGLYNEILGHITKLLNLKRENGYPINICAQSILGNWNINDIHSHITFFKELGLDGIIFQPIQYPFGLPIPENWHLNFNRFPKSEEKIQNAINYLLNSKQNNGFIMNSKEEIELWRLYFSDPEYLHNGINPCRAHEQNLIIDVCGNVKFCFNKIIEPMDKIGNILTTPIDEILFGKNALQVKESMKKCNRACGIMACHIDDNLRVK